MRPAVFVKRAVCGNEATWIVNVLLGAPPCYPRGYMD